MTKLIATPQWIAKMYAATSGRDHLGLGSVSADQILPTLSPGINVLTIHPRYYSFYTFLLDEFWRSDRPRSRSAWVRFYRPREFIFSVGAHMCDRPQHLDMGNIVGAQKTAPLATDQLETYDSTTNYIKSALGGYGLYYRSVIAELGLIYPGGRGFPYPVDVPSKRGKKVADAFRKAVEGTKYYRDYFHRDEVDVPIGMIRQYIRQACLCQLQVPGAPDRPLLLDVFLHEGVDSPSRRATFRLMLSIADQTSPYPIGEDVFRQLIYFRAADNGAQFIPQESVLDTYRRWRLYQAREYYSFALNALWDYLCEWGLAQGGEVHPIPLRRFWEHMEGALNFDGLATRLGCPPPHLGPRSGFQALLNWMETSTGTDAASFDERCGLDSPIHEHRLYRLVRDHRTAPDVMIAGMITMLGLLFLRFGRPERWLKPEWVISRMGSDGRLSVSGFMSTVRNRLKRGFVPVSDIARWLYTDYVMLQHQLVATGKLPDNTFRFRREGDRLRFYNLSNRLRFMSSRFDALSTTIHELGLCGHLGHPDHHLTADGQRLLETGDLQWMT